MDDDAEVIAEFLIESHENLDRLVDDVLALEHDPEASATLASAFRTIHTIKGTCGFLGYDRLERVTHVGENLLSKLRDGSLSVDGDIVTILLELADTVRGILGVIEAQGNDGADDHEDLVARLGAMADGQKIPAAVSVASATAAETAMTEVATVESADIAGITDIAESATAEATRTGTETDTDDPGPTAADADAADGPSQVGEVLVAAGATDPDAVALALAEQDLGDGRRLGDILVDHGTAEADEIDRALRDHAPSAPAAAAASPTPSTVATAAPSGAAPAGNSISESTIRVDVGVLDRLMNLVGELVLSRNNIAQQVSADAESNLLTALQQLHLVTGELQECVMKTRMQPIGSVWSKFNRVTRDLAMQCGKQVRLEMEGEETELDKTILEAIKDPLTHIVRNAVDHGIETPAARTAAGKPAEGVLRMSAHHEGGQVIIVISDDGGGIDAERVLEKAVERGLVTAAQAPQLSQTQIVGLVFEPGFSTAGTVSNVSGRGVGMDVVKTNIERIGGTIEVESALGVGTTLRVKIPLTLAIVPALMVRCGDGRFALPQIEVQELVRLDRGIAEAVELIGDAQVYRLRGQLLPLVHLREMLGIVEADDEAPVTIAVVSSDSRSWGLVLDGVVSTEEIVVKPMSNLLRSVQAFSGSTILGDGRVSLILDVARIGRLGNVASTAEASRALEQGTETAAQRRRAKLLVVANGAEQVAIDLAEVDRLEQFDRASFERSGNQEVVQYRDGIMPIATLGMPDTEAPITTVVFDRPEGLVGLAVERIVDVVEVELDDEGWGATAVVGGRVADVVDPGQLLVGATSWRLRTSRGPVGAMA